jgi:uncharacterized cupredoxin-like copper-binding protein
MRPVVRLAGVVALCAAVLGAAEVAGARRERPPARLLVSADEHYLMLSRQSIAAGPAVIQFHNRGEDPHDLRMRRIPQKGVSARRTFSVPETTSGNLEELEARLPSGRYKLWCSLPGHAQAGMRARLRVKRAR